MLTVHLLAVGDGDCTLVELPDGELMVVDIMNGRRDNSHRKEFVNPIQYIQNLGRYSSLMRYVQTHPHMDHMDGLAELADLYQIANFWDTANTRKKPEDFAISGFREIDWDRYQSLRSDKTRVRNYLRDKNQITYNDESKKNFDFYVLSPTQKLIDDTNSSAEEWNPLSYIIVLRHNGFKLLLSGDASDSAWEDLYNWTKYDGDAKRLLSNITIFKAAHHGRSSSYCGSDILKLMDPQAIVVSKDNVPSDQSAYQNYFNHMNAKGRATFLFDTSKGTVVSSYDETTNKYSINYK